jgi:hypothetical protein
VEPESDPNTRPEALLVDGDELPAIEARLEPAALAEGLIELALEDDPCAPNVVLKPAPACSSPAEPDPPAEFVELDPCEPGLEFDPAPAGGLLARPE